MVFTDFYDDLTARLRVAGDWIWPLGLRWILAYEFFTAGMTKLNGNNWFASRIDSFPQPFKLLGADFSWFAATWGELVFSVLLFFGLFTRFAAFSLVVITAVAIVTVHWPADWSSLAELWKGYSVSRVVEDGQFFGNFRIPLLFLLMLLPLVFHGAGKLSVDQILLILTARSGDNRRISDVNAAGFAFLILAVPLIFLMPITGFVFLAIAALCFAIPRFS